MHICLGTDIDVDALSGQNPPSRDLLVLGNMTEHVLCTIKLYQDGLLQVTPGFSGVTAEASGGFPEGIESMAERCALSAFLDESTVQGAIATGFKLTTSKVRSKKGVEYEYMIQNMNDVLIPYQLEEIQKLQKASDMRASALHKSSNEQSSWKQDPPSAGRHKVVAVYAEIVSGQDFDGRKVSVNYQVRTYQGWDLRTGNLSDGIGEKDIAAIKAIRKSSEGGTDGVFGTEHLSGADVLALDGYADGIYARGMLYGTTHTAVVKDSRRPSRLAERPVWNAPFVSPAFEEGSRLFIGTCFFLITVLAIILGQTFPFWLVPALVVLFTVGTGTPGGPTQVLLRVSKGSAPGGGDKRGNTYTQSERDTRLAGPLVSSPVAHFNHLINLSFDVQDSLSQQDSLPLTPFQSGPIIHFQVYSAASMDRSVLEGYGHFQIPGEGEGEGEGEASTSFVSSVLFCSPLLSLLFSSFFPTFLYSRLLSLSVKCQERVV
jgi:Ciliary basal body-associated, B9 protein